MLVALAVVSLALAPPAGLRSYSGPEAVVVDGSSNMFAGTLPKGQITLIHHAVAGDAEAPATAEAPAPADNMPRYYPTPLTDAQWQRLGGRQVLIILGTAGRECVTFTRADKSAVYYVHPKNGAQQAPLAAVTAVHENSWECAEGRESTPSEWARVGTGVGVGFSAVGMLMGVLYDAGRAGKPDPSDHSVKHFMYAGLGLTTTLLGTPIVAIGGASTSRDLRVRGKIWARGLGYALYAGAVVFSALWLIGQYGDKEPLRFVGITSLAGGLGLAGSAFMAVDALSSRAELKTLERQDTGQARKTARRGQLHVGAGPSGQGFGLALGGRF
ncbi:hypothetical protein SAMN02745121_01906 [Nannocystis exedens]|uniref:Uncharacterized protein n=1 Tax=Nannocystis exedens TaxID=54 RepID=A0A1I1VYS4_9BACT|nr:hypothetical protein [Nannocystis exedens]PCC72789.1 hypothetical protein NAEX_05874 [Nannocystis exedens]SFD85770.1 hypothetical protein SAMN02745121_01906 [Nannocystis exedens]